MNSIRNSIEEPLDIPNIGEYGKYTRHHKKLFIQFLNLVGQSNNDEVLAVIKNLQTELPGHRSKLTIDGFKELSLLYYAAEKAYYEYHKIEKTPTLVKKSSNKFDPPIFAKKTDSPGRRFLACIGSKGKTVGRAIVNGALGGALWGGVTGFLGGSVLLPGVGTTVGTVGGAVFGAARGAVLGGVFAVAWAASDCRPATRPVGAGGGYNDALDELVRLYGWELGMKYWERLYKPYYSPPPLEGYTPEPTLPTLLKNLSPSLMLYKEPTTISFVIELV